jgi:hypothetical protein
VPAGGVAGKDLFSDDEFTAGAVRFMHASHAQSSKVISTSAINVLNLLFTIYHPPFVSSFSEA